MLNKLDIKLTRGGHFLFAIPMIFCKTKKVAEHVRESITKFIKGKFYLKVNKENTVVSYIRGVKYLGYSFYCEGFGE